MDKLNQIKTAFDRDLKDVHHQVDLAELKAGYLGKKGKLSQILKGLKDADEQERKTIGTQSNQLKEQMLVAIENRQQSLEVEEINAKLKKEWHDLTDRDSIWDLGSNRGGYHPLSMVQREVEDIFVSMGFDILDGPHIEDDFHNFEALNIPADHPARDMQDTFWFSDHKHLLRTHTSTIQVRGMEEKDPPFKFVGPGKVFRCEATDASHEAVFHQLEGMLVGKDISVANLIYFMETLLREIFKEAMKIRLRPGFFPFVEPGFELDIACLICRAKGCPVCKQSGWVELLPCGMVHPHVLKSGGIDVEKYNGFAFGLGLDRLVMMRYGIDDIRHLHAADLRFSEQFACL